MKIVGACGLCMSIFAGIVFFVVTTIWGVQMSNNVTGKLELVGRANNIERAERELTAVLSYLESKGLTSGSTAVFYNTPQNDIGFWYQNLKEARDELLILKDEKNQLVLSNQLIKLRETVMDHSAKGDSVTCPDGLSCYPYQTLVVAIAFLLFFSIFIFGAMIQ